MNYKNTILLCMIVLLLSGCNKNERVPEVGDTSSGVEEVPRTETVSSKTADFTESDELAERETAMESSVDDNETENATEYTSQPTLNIDYTFFSENIYCLYDGEHYGYVDAEGNDLTAMVYDVAYPFSEGLGCAMIDGIYGFVDTQGEVAIPFSYLDAAPFSEGLAYFYGDEGYGFMKPDGSVAFTLDCDSVSSFREGLAYFSIDGKYGYIDSAGRVVIDPIYQDAGYFENGMAVVRKDGSWRIINTRGEEIPQEESEIMSAVDDTFTQSESDLSKVLLKNSITPRKGLYWKLSHGKYVDIATDLSGEIQNLRKYNNYTEYDFIKKFALYDWNTSGQLILYCSEEPFVSMGFPMSDSAFYIAKNNQLYQILSANECGGSARGDYVCFWKNVDTGELLMGTCGAAGGFGGFSDYGNIYTYQNNILQEVNSFTHIEWFSPYYEDEELLRDAHLFYNGDVPYSQENILEAEDISEYLVNDKRVTIEEYRSTVEQFEKVMVLK